MEHAYPKKIHPVLPWIDVEWLKKVIEDQTHRKNHEGEIKEVYSLEVKGIGLVEEAS
jgi:hypothetical protein